MCQEDLGAGGLDRYTALAHLRDPFLHRSLLHQSPPCQHGSNRSPEREPMLGADRHRFLGRLPDILLLSTQLPQPGNA